MAEIEAHNIAMPGDVLVIDGVPGISNMGGVSAFMARRQGTVGAVISGGARDLSHSRSLGFPVGSSSVTPTTGKWRIQTVEVNGTVNIACIRVEPGDIVVADEDGVCIIPIARAEDIVSLVEKKVNAEQKRLAALDAGVPIRDLPKPA
jgi:regulator of RNase E activity RraA